MVNQMIYGHPRGWVNPVTMRADGALVAAWVASGTTNVAYASAARLAVRLIGRSRYQSIRLLVMCRREQVSGLLSPSMLPGLCRVGLM
jgi:hypothetical protein